MLNVLVKIGYSLVPGWNKNIVHIWNLGVCGCLYQFLDNNTPHATWVSTLWLAISRVVLMDWIFRCPTNLRKTTNLSLIPNRRNVEEVPLRSKYITPDIPNITGLSDQNLGGFGTVQRWMMHAIIGCTLIYCDDAGKTMYTNIQYIMNSQLYYNHSIFYV